ncbi:hypothetical protein RB195_014496 [Necator americanus]|uniref:Uncharacterized protein n=1 Tax=Necator americanus TaxID=51031 RepID=A0ABR1E0U8_NECAM
MSKIPSQQVLIVGIDAIAVSNDYNYARMGQQSDPLGKWYYPAKSTGIIDAIISRGRAQREMMAFHFNALRTAQVEDEYSLQLDYVLTRN